MTPRSDAAAHLPAAATITALLTARGARSPSGIGQWTLSREGRWEPLTWAELQARVAAIARGLRALGLEPGQPVAVLAAGHAVWDQMHLAVLAARGVVAGLDTHASAAQLETILALVRPQALVVDDLSTLDRFGDATLAALRFIVVLSPEAGVSGAVRPPAVTLQALLERGGDSAGATWDDAGPDDPAWVIFTSGTTGQPKGLMYRHRQVRLAASAILDAFADIAEGARLVSWLPLSNPFQRIINLCALACGAQTYYVADPRDVMRHLPAIRPQVFVGVPRFFEKFHAGAVAMLDNAGPWHSRIARWALDVGQRHAALQRDGRPPPLTLRLACGVADGLVLGRIRAAFGGELRYLVSGSAAMPPWLLERLHAMGLLVLEAYGLSECIVPVAANRPGAFRFGTVGRVMRGNEIRLAADGELLLRSDGVFEGYLGGADAAGSVDAQGWLATGDFAQIDGDGFVRLVGRKSEVFKTSTGRRVAPGAVEAALRALPGVEHAAVFGAGRQSLLAVVALAADAPGAVEALRNAAARTLQSLPDYQRPAGLVVTRRPFTIESGELTGNLKLRRHSVREHYSAALDALAAVVDGADARRRFVGAFEPGIVDLVVL